MKGAARLVFGALIGVALGYVFVLLANRGAPPKRAVPLAVRRSATPRTEQPEPAEEIAAS
jgi:hypothetical protein